MKIEVVFGDADKQTLIEFEVPSICTVSVALETFHQEYPAYALKVDPDRVGIFSKKVSLDTLLNPGDRIEIYRPLQIDPKEARRLRTR